jgi:hypothetical protein
MNGYIKVNINGQEVGLKFGYPAIKEFTLACADKPGVYLAKDEKEESTITDLGIAKLIHSAYKNECLLLERSPVLTFKDFNEWVEGAMEDEARKDVIIEVLGVWATSRYTKLAIEKMKEQKKSPTTTKKIRK